MVVGNKIGKSISNARMETLAKKKKPRVQRFPDRMIMAKYCVG